MHATGLLLIDHLKLYKRERDPTIGEKIADSFISFEDQKATNLYKSLEKNGWVVLSKEKDPRNTLPIYVDRKCLFAVEAPHRLEETCGEQPFIPLTSGSYALLTIQGECLRELPFVEKLHEKLLQTSLGRGTSFTSFDGEEEPLSHELLFKQRSSFVVVAEKSCVWFLVEDGATRAPPEFSSHHQEDRLFFRDNAENLPNLRRRLERNVPLSPYDTEELVPFRRIFEE